MFREDMQDRRRGRGVVTSQEETLTKNPPGATQSVSMKPV